MALTPRPKIICAVVIAHMPCGAAGNTWAFLQWAIGLRNAGCDVWLVEHLDRSDLIAGSDPGEPSVNERHWHQVVAEFGFAGRATLFLDDSAPDAEVFSRWAEDATAFLNLSGQFKLMHRVGHVPSRAYVDLDPAFTQLWGTTLGVDMNWAPHTHFLTVGLELPSGRAQIPPTGHAWHATLPPVCLNYWSAADDGPLPVDVAGCWTTVTHWHGYKSIPWEGQLYADKRESWVHVRDLPRRTGCRMLVATDMTPEWTDYADFAAAGWRIRPAAEVCGDWRVYRRFLSAGAGEFSVAKHGYVASRCGWFSDRSATYLALGRPVALQDTGWSTHLPSGDGLRAWDSIEAAEEALREFERDPSRHRRAARRLAEEYLDATRVIPAALAHLGVELGA